MEPHEYANLFPMMSVTEFAELSEGMKMGYLEEFPIITLDGKILDGRNRWKACQATGVGPILKEYAGSDPIRFVVSANRSRRQLSESQLGMVGARIAELRHGQRSDRVDVSGDTSKTPSRKEAADMVGVGEATVGRGRSVLTKGVPELAAAVDAGGINITTAAHIAKLPAARQLEVLAEGPEAVKEKAKEIRDFGGEIAPCPKPDSEYVAPEAPPKLGKFTLDQTAHILPQIMILIGKISPKDIKFESALTEVITACQKRINTKK